VEVNGEVAFGELITTPSNQAKVEQGISTALQVAEQAEQLLCSIPEQLKSAIWEATKPHWTKLGLDIRAKGIAHVYDTAISGKTENESESTESNESSTEHE
jgi:hypothetical protein